MSASTPAEASDNGDSTPPTPRERNKKHNTKLHSTIKNTTTTPTPTTLKATIQK